MNLFLSPQLHLFAHVIPIFCAQAWLGANVAAQITASARGGVDRWRRGLQIQVAHGKIHIEAPIIYIFLTFLPIVLILLGSSMRRFSLQFFMYFLFARFIFLVAEIWESFLALWWLQLRLAATGWPLGRGTWRTMGCSTWRAIAHIESTDFEKGVRGAILGGLFYID